MPFGLGFFAVAGAGAAGSYDLLETQVLTGSQASITFSSLSTYSNYKHLQIRWVARTDKAASAADIMVMLLNSNAATKTHMMEGSGSSVSSAADQYGAKTIGFPAAPDFPADGFGAGIIDLLDAFDTNKNKTIRSFSGLPTVGGGYRSVALASGFYSVTAATSSLTLDVDGNFISGSRFSLYGIKGA